MIDSNRCDPVVDVPPRSGPPPPPTLKMSWEAGAPPPGHRHGPPMRAAQTGLLVFRRIFFPVCPTDVRAFAEDIDFVPQHVLLFQTYFGCRPATVHCSGDSHRAGQARTVFRLEEPFFPTPFPPVYTHVPVLFPPPHARR